MKGFISNLGQALVLGILVYALVSIVNRNDHIFGKTQRTKKSKSKKEIVRKDIKPSSTKESPPSSPPKPESFKDGAEGHFVSNALNEPTKKKSSAIEPKLNPGYQVQLGVFTKENTPIHELKDLSKYGELILEPIGTNRHRVLLGNYPDKNQASKALNGVKSLGYTDAFVISLERNLNPGSEEPMLFLGFFPQAPFSKLSALSSIGKVFLETKSDNTYAAYLGRFKPGWNAIDAKKQVLDLGFPNTRITQVSDEELETFLSLGIPEKSKSKPEQTANLSGQKKAPPVVASNLAKKPVEVLRSTPVESQSFVQPATFTDTKANKTGVVQLIQVAALSKPIVTEYEKLKLIGNVYSEYKIETQLTHILVGPYYSENALESALTKIRSNGFTKAFVKDLPATNANRIQVFSKK